MSDIWAIMIFVPFLLLVPIFRGRSARGKVQDMLEASFAEQVTSMDGVEVRAIELEAVHRWFGIAQWDRSGKLMNLDAQWLCRAHDGSYLLVIATGSMPEKETVIHWTWRHLSEERARQSLLHKRKAYRAVFGTYPKK